MKNEIILNSVIVSILRAIF